MTRFSAWEGKAFYPAMVCMAALCMPACGRSYPEQFGTYADSRSGWTPMRGDASQFMQKISMLERSAPADDDLAAAEGLLLLFEACTSGTELKVLFHNDVVRPGTTRVHRMIEIENDFPRPSSTVIPMTVAPVPGKPAMYVLEPENAQPPGIYVVVGDGTFGCILSGLTLADLRLTFARAKARLSGGELVFLRSRSGPVVVKAFAQDVHMRNEDGSTRDETQRFSFTHVSTPPGFEIAIWEQPVGQVRLEAEAYLLNLLGVSRESACRLTITASAPRAVSHGMEHWRAPSFCAGG